MQFKNIENYDLVKEALIEANRRDLIGFGPECLIPPRPIGRNSNRTSKGRPLVVVCLKVIRLIKAVVVVNYRD